MKISSKLVNNHIISFGKYKDQKLVDIIKEDPRYIIWLFKQPWLESDTREAISDSMDTIQITFGRHNGKTLLELKKDVPKYFKWLTRMDNEVET
jgi:uncharacterized protein (DUF3820 family)